VTAAPAGRAISRRALAGGAFVVSGAAFGAINLIWRREIAEPQVALLGAGSQLSALVASGNARLLVATGDDPTALANALAAVRRPTMRRIDILLVAGSGASLAAPALIAGDPSFRELAAIAPFPRSEEIPALRDLPVIATPREIDLPGNVTVTVDAAPADDGGERWAWRVVVGHGGASAALVSAAGDAGRFPWPSAPGLLAVASGDPLAAWEAVRPPAIAFPDAAVTPKALRAAAATAAAGPAWTLRVFPGEAARIPFADGRLELPSGAATRFLPDTATPASG